MKKKYNLDIDLVSDAFYEALLEECQKRVADVEKIEDTINIVIDDIEIKFKVG